jgi:hypothetical protein
MSKRRIASLFTIFLASVAYCQGPAQEFRSRALDLSQKKQWDQAKPQKVVLGRADTDQRRDRN